MLVRSVPENADYLLAVEEAWATLRIPEMQLKVLVLTVAHGHVTGTYLQKRIGIKAPNLTGVVDHLVAAGLVEREYDRFDRRIVHYIPTDAGRALVLDLLPRPSETNPLHLQIERDWWEVHATEIREALRDETRMRRFLAVAANSPTDPVALLLQHFPELEDNTPCPS